MRVLDTVTFQVIAGAVACLFASGASAQSRSQHPTVVSPLGVWRGTSLCLVRPSACKDEIVVYRMAPTKTADSVTLDARKIVRGEEEEMGVLPCEVRQRGKQVICTIPQGTWYFTVRSDSLVGELRLRNDTKFRDIRTARALR